MSGFRELSIYKEAYQLAIKLHRASMKLPTFELYEQGSQVRRSSKSIKDCISEGYGRRRYQADYIRFLIYAQSSCDECSGQLEMICELYPNLIEFKDLLDSYIQLGKMINKFIQAVETR